MDDFFQDFVQVKAVLPWFFANPKAAAQSAKEANRRGPKGASPPDRNGSWVGDCWMMVAVFYLILEWIWIDGWC